MHFSPRISIVSAAACAFLLAQSAPAQTLPATAPARLPVPDALAQDHARLMIYTLFKDEYAKNTAPDRLALAKRLLLEAAGTKDDPAARYVLLTETIDLAAIAGDPVTAFTAAAQLGRFYVVDAIELKKQALFRTHYIVTTPAANEALARLALDTADEAALADAFTSAEQLVNLAAGAADKTQKVAFVASLQSRLAALRDLIHDFPKIQQAQEHLHTDPVDPAAHLLVGSFYALRKGQWSVGLPHLAAGADPVLQNLASQDLALQNPATPGAPLKQALLGDAWWDYGENASGPVRLHSQRHACDWYRLALPSLAGITLTRIQSRIRAVTPSTNSLANTPDTASPGIDLLPLIDPAKDAGAGKWSLAGGTLQCAPSRYASIALPYTPPDEYDLRVTFIRNAGDAPITVLLAAHNKSFGFALDIKGEARFERVAGTIAKQNPTAAPVAVTNNRRYTLTLQIRNEGLRALLDDKLIAQWKTDYKDLSRYALWKLPQEKLCGLGVNNGNVTFYAAQLIEITGKGHPTR